MEVLVFGKTLDVPRGYNNKPGSSYILAKAFRLFQSGPRRKCIHRRNVQDKQVSRLDFIWSGLSLTRFTKPNTPDDGGVTFLRLVTVLGLKKRYNKEVMNGKSAYKTLTGPSCQSIERFAVVLNFPSDSSFSSRGIRFMSSGTGA